MNIRWQCPWRFFWHNRSRSQCFQVQLVTCWHRPYFLYWVAIYSLNSLKIIGNCLEVSNFNRLFLKLNAPHSLKDGFSKFEHVVQSLLYTHHFGIWNMEPHLNHVPLKYRWPIKVSNQTRHICLRCKGNFKH